MEKSSRLNIIREVFYPKEKPEVYVVTDRYEVYLPIKLEAIKDPYKNNNEKLFRKIEDIGLVKKILEAQYEK